MRLSKIVEQYLGNLPLGIVLEGRQVTRNLRRAVRLYCGHATLKRAPSEAELQLPAGGVHTAITEDDDLAQGQDFDLTPSEFAVIAPLWHLYNEFENALALEASRAQGLDLYGRSGSEVGQAIRERELAMSAMCFMEPVVSI